MKLYRPNFLNAKLRTKFLIYILTTTIIVFLVVISYIIIKSENDASERAFTYVDANAREYANMVRSELEGDFATCRTIMISFSEYKSLSKEPRTKLHNSTLLNVLKNNKQFVSVWCDWELNNLDPTYKKEHGRESYTFYKEADEVKYRYEIIDTTDNPTGIYYDIKANPTEILTEPYAYSYSGKKSDEILEASVCIPIMENDRFIGLVGADVELERIEKITSRISPFKGSYSLMISSDGKLFNRSNDDGHEIENISDIDIIQSLEFDFNKKLKEGNSFSFSFTQVDGNDYYATFAPLTLGESGDYWYIGVVVPIDVILEKVRFESIVSLLVGILGIFFLALVTWIVARMITKPLVTTTAVLNVLASGNVNETSKVKIKTHDELAEMGIAVNTLIGTLKSSADFANKIGDGKLDEKYTPLSSKDILGNSLVNMRNRLRELKLITDKNNWLQDSIVKVSEVLQGEKSFSQLGNDILIKLADILYSPISAIYINENNTLSLIASYAYNIRKSNSNKFTFGEGLIGQAALEQKTLVFNDIPDDYIQIKSGLGQSKPSSILILPLVYQKMVVGVIEFGSSKEFTEEHLGFLGQVSENVAIAFRSITLRTEMEDLLSKTQEQAEELTVQQEELVDANKELKSQTEELRVSEEELQQQQEELRVTNEELEVKTKYLEEQKADISEKNLQLENAQNDLERKADELGIASKYKSDFLANMSHELRTPLNSLLILSRDLADNSEDNLTPDQVESSEIIYNSGKDLLTMINDILDLSKIESGRMTINVENVEVGDVSSTVLDYFTHLTRQKGISLEVEVEDNFPSSIKVDQQKLEQIIKNFVSNGIKFTSEGGIKVKFHMVDNDIPLNHSELIPEESYGVSVIDTGVGIPQDKQLEIFEAFRQADTSISKNFGGTGLGLSISKELAKLLGGEIQLSSEVGKGSVFTVYLPLSVEMGSVTKSINEDKKTDNIKESKSKQKKVVKNQQIIDRKQTNFIVDDSKNLVEGDQFILVIEDDPSFAKILLKECHNNDFKCVAVSSGEEGLLICKNKGVVAIILDINLPGINGWGVLKLLKDDPETRHIPVHIMSGDDANADSNKNGAIGFLRKPVNRDSINNAFGKIQDYISKDVGSLLLVEDDDTLRHSIKKNNRGGWHKNY